MKPLTVSEAAERLRTSSGSVRRWCDTGILRSYRLPSGQRRIEADDVERLAGQLSSPAPTAA